MRKERNIFSDYDIWEDYHEAAEEYLQEEGSSEPDENKIWSVCEEYSNLEWEDTKEELKDFFGLNQDGYILYGTVVTWDGKYTGWFIFDDFDELWNRICPRGVYGNFRFYDVDGHLYFDKSRQDGSNHYEIRELTKKGREMADAWEYNWEDKRSERELHHTITSVNFYSRLPHFAHRVYGCPKRESVKIA